MENLTFLKACEKFQQIYTEISRFRRTWQQARARLRCGAGEYSDSLSMPTNQYLLQTMNSVTVADLSCSRSDISEGSSQRVEDHVVEKK